MNGILLNAITPQKEEIAIAVDRSAFSSAPWTLGVFSSSTADLIIGHRIGSSFINEGSIDQAVILNQIPSQSERVILAAGRQYPTYVSPFRPWLPTQKATLKNWASAKRSSITEIANVVSDISDLSANSNDYSQTTEDKKPIFSATGFNGRPSFDFDGVDDNVTTALGLAGISEDEETFAIALKADTATPGGLRYPFGNSNFAGYFFSYANANAIRWRTGNGDGNVSSVGRTDFTLENALTTETILISRRSVLNNNIEFFVDGVSVHTDTHTNPTGTADYFMLGDRSNESGPFPGLISEIIAFNQYLDDNDIEILAGYIHHEWGLANRLPSDHPYRLNPPSIALSLDERLAAFFANYPDDVHFLIPSGGQSNEVGQTVAPDSLAPMTFRSEIYYDDDPQTNPVDPAWVTFELGDNGVTRGTANGGQFTAGGDWEDRSNPAVRITSIFESAVSVKKLSHLFRAQAGQGFEGANDNWAIGNKLRDDWASIFVTQVTSTLQARIELAYVLPYIWVHGEADDDELITGQNYEANLTAFINQYRTIIGIPTAPFIITERQVSGAAGNAAVRASQTNVAANDVNVFLIPTADLATSDGTHYTEESHQTIAQRYWEIVLDNELIAQIPEA